MESLKEEAASVALVECEFENNQESIPMPLLQLFGRSGSEVLTKLGTFIFSFT